MIFNLLGGHFPLSAASPRHHLCLFQGKVLAAGFPLLSGPRSKTSHLRSVISKGFLNFTPHDSHH
jgi:hypothetical protein